MGQIRVTVQEAHRLNAISNLAEAMVQLARALNAAPQVTITGCHITAGDGSPGILVDTTPDITETEIIEYD